MIRTVIAEDSALAQNFYTEMLSKHDEFQILAVCSDAFEAEKRCMAGDVDLVLMDVLTKDNHSGLAAAVRIRKASAHTKVVIVTSLVDPDVIAKAKSGAADSLWYKDHGSADLMDVIQRTLAGERVFPESAPGVRLGKLVSSDLSPRQIQVLRRFVMGLTYEEIASEMGISERGVRWHLTEIMEKGGFKNRYEMLAALLQNNFIVTTLLDSE